MVKTTVIIISVWKFGALKNEHWQGHVVDDEDDDVDGVSGGGGSAVALEDGVIKTFEDHEGRYSVLLSDSCWIPEIFAINVHCVACG